MIQFKSHTFKLGCMLILVFIYFLVELVVGHILNSLTLVADSFHMLSDLVALIIGIAARRISRWPKSSKNTFGWQRAEVLGTLLNTVMLITLTFTIFIEIVQKFIRPELIDRPKLLLGVGSGGLLINIFGLLLLGCNHGHSHGAEESIEVIIKDEGENQPDDDVKDNDLKMEVYKHRNNSGKSGHGHSHSSRNMNIQAVFLHILADFFGSVAVVGSALVIWLVPMSTSNQSVNKTILNDSICNATSNTTDVSWKAYVDPSISLVMVVLILISAAPLAKKSAMILLQSVPKDVSISNLKMLMEEIEGIDKVHDLHVWQLQSDVLIGTVHIRCSNDQYVAVSKKVKKLFHDFNIHCTTIQAEFDEHLSDNEDSGVGGHNVPTNDNGDKCVLSCGDRSVTRGNNLCKGKESCCPTKGVPNVVVATAPEAVPLLAIVSVPHQFSAPCLTSLDAQRKVSSEAPLADSDERQ